MARKGILGTKLGMTQVFDEDNRVVPVTVVKAGPNVVTRIRTPEVDGYSAVQLAYGEISPRKINKPVTGQYAAARTYVDVTGTSKGKGFAGTMKRHGFSGQGASHGAQAVHRRPGSIGGCATPARVFKGTRMAGRMGNDRVTTQNLLVHKVDAENGVLLIKGAVPGRTGGLVVVRSAIKRGEKEWLPTTPQRRSRSTSRRPPARPKARLSCRPSCSMR